MCVCVCVFFCFSDFPIRYEGPHVISEKQVWVGVVTKGCDGVNLNSSYANRLTVKPCHTLNNELLCGIFLKLKQFFF